jgi:hypothetical protein
MVLQTDRRRKGTNKIQTRISSNQQCQKHQVERQTRIQWHCKQSAEGRGPIRFKQGSQVINNDKSTEWNDKLGSNGTANKSPKEGDQ